MNVNTRHCEGAYFFLAQPITFATNLPGSAKTIVVSTRIMCVTAMMTVTTVPTKETAVSW